jgi:hypothetical protein
VAGWREWRLTRHSFVPAPRLSLADYRRLSPRKRQLHDLHRAATHANLPLQDTPMSLAVTRIMRSRLQTNALKHKPTTCPGLMITGGGYQGKTETACEIAAAFEDAWLELHRQLNPNAVPGTRDLHAPVAYVQTPVTAKPKSTCEAILDFFGADHHKMTLPQLTRAVRRAQGPRPRPVRHTPTAAASCAALLTVAEDLTRASDPDTVRDLAAPLLAVLPATGRDWIKQFLHRDGHCSPGLHTALGPAVGAAHIVARTGISSFTAKRRYPAAPRGGLRPAPHPPTHPHRLDRHILRRVHRPAAPAAAPRHRRPPRPPGARRPTHQHQPVPGRAPAGRPPTRWPTSATGSPTPAGRPPSTRPSPPSRSIWTSPWTV